MPSSVNEVFDDIFQEEISTGKSKGKQPENTAPQSNSGFFFNQNDVNFINQISQKKAKAMTEIINTEALKRTIVAIGNEASDGEMLIAETILAEIESQVSDFSNQLADDSFKNFLSGKSQQLQLTGYPAS